MKEQPARSRSPKRRSHASSCQPAEIRLEPSGEVVVEHHSAPPTRQPDKQIHPRRPLPLVPNAPSEAAKKEKKKENV